MTPDLLPVLALIAALTWVTWLGTGFRPAAAALLASMRDGLAGDLHDQR